jgi:hypothetical protein
MVGVDKKGGKLDKLGALARQGGVVARVGVFAPEPSVRRSRFRFARLRTATQVLWVSSPFFVVKKNLCICYDV